MPGSQTTPGPTAARNNAPADFAFRQVNNVGTRIDNGFAAQWLAYTLPYRRFADVLADACARIGGDVDCYSFIAVDFHHILPASLPAHSLTLPISRNIISTISAAPVSTSRGQRSLGSRGSPARTLKVTPPFDGFYFVDLNADKL